MTERKGESGGYGEERDPALPADEEAAWAQIVAAYGDEPREAPGDVSGDTSGGERDDASGGERDDASGGASGGERADTSGGEQGGGEGDETPARERGAVRPSHSFTVYRAGTGPRDWQPLENEDDDHFVPPEPPPLPEADTVTKFGWVAALGGPLLLLGAVLFDVHMSWWIITLGLGGFLGGFAALLTRLRDDRDDEFDDPGGGAVV